VNIGVRGKWDYCTIITQKVCRTCQSSFFVIGDEMKEFEEKKMNETNQ